MAKTSLTVHVFEHKPRKEGAEGNWDTVGGHGLLNLFEHFCQTVHPDHLVDERKAKYLRVREEPDEGRMVTRAGRMCLVNVDSGIWGNGGQTYDVRNHRRTHARASYESATVTTRVGLVVPRNSATAVIFVEQEGRQGEGFKLIEHFKHALMEDWTDSHYPLERVTYREAWLEDAAPTQVEVRNRSWKPSLVGQATAEDVPAMAELGRILRPVRGSGRFSDMFKRKLLRGDIEVSSFIGVPEEEDTETVVSVERDGRTKSFTLDKPTTPSMQIPLTQGTAPRLPDNQIMDEMLDEAREFFQELWVGWEDSWIRTTGEDEGYDVQWDHKYIEPRPDPVGASSNGGDGGTERIQGLSQETPTS